MTDANISMGVEALKQPEREMITGPSRGMDEAIARIFADYGELLGETAAAHRDDLAISESSQFELRTQIMERIQQAIPGLGPINLNRRQFNAATKVGYLERISDFAYFWANRVGRREIIDRESERNELLTFAKGATPEAITTLELLTEGFRPGIRATEISRSVVVPALEAELKAGEISESQVFAWLANADIENPLVMGLIAVLVDDSVIRQKESIFERSRNAYQELGPEQFLDEFVSACKEEPSEWYREAKFLKFLESFAGIETGEELRERLATQLDLLPDDLMDSLKKFGELTKNRVAADVRKLVDQVLIWEKNPTDEELDLMWNRVLASLPAHLLAGGGGRLEQIKAKNKLRSPQNTRPKQTPEEVGPDNKEEEPIRRSIFSIKPTEAGTYIVDEGEEEAVKMINGYIGQYPGVGNLQEQIWSAIDYLRTTRMPKGIKKFEMAVRLMPDRERFPGYANSTLPIWSFKHTPDTGLEGSRIFRKTRIEFVFLPDGNIGLRNIHMRDDRVSGRRKKA